MTQRQLLSSTNANREAVRAFFLWLFRDRRRADPAAPLLILAERTPLAGLVPSTSSVDELFDEMTGLDRERLAQECIAALNPGAECPCEREVG